MFKKSLIGIILFGVIAVLLLQIDDDLNPEVTAFLELAEPAEQSEAYLYLLGIVAAEDEDPLTVGKQLFADMQQAEEKYQFGDESFSYEGYPEDKKLALPQSELFCRRWEEGCWDAVLSSEHNLKQILTVNSSLLERYKIFIGLDGDHTLAQPTSMEIYPSYQYLTKANRLVILKAINTARIAEPEQVVKALTENILLLRHKLKSADTLIGKMVYTLMASDLLDALSLLIHNGRLIFEGSLPSISLAERDFETVMAREFAMGYDMLADMDRNPDFLAAAALSGEKIGGSSPRWWVRIFFKLNMTANEGYLFYKDAVMRSKLEQVEFTGIGFENTEKSSLKPSSIRNYAGNILNSVASPNFDRYIAIIFDLNAKIAIFNQTANKAELSDNLDYIQNPYYEKGGTAYYSEDGKSICLTGPLEDNKNQRCLRVKL